jgi:hypothetical protein
MSRPSALLAAAAVLLALLAAPAAGSDRSGRIIRVTGTLRAVTDAVPDVTLCNAEGGAYAIGPTDLPESGSSTITGTFRGTGRFCGHLVPGIGPGGSLPFVETDTFTGTVRGCGTGTVIYHVTGFVGTRFDTGRGGLPTEEDWRIARGSGLAGLSGLRSGGGHDSGQINLDSSIDTDFKGTVTCAHVKPKPATTYDTALSGVWTVTGCAPTSVPSSVSFPMPLTSVCAGQSQGSWNGLVIDHNKALMGEDLGLTSQDDIELRGAAADGSCGTLHIRQAITVAGDTSELKGVATIVSGTGDWVGSTGSYTTNGTFNAGVGEGSYEGVWRRPGPARQEAAADCRP